MVSQDDVLTNSYGLFLTAIIVPPFIVIIGYVLFHKSKILNESPIKYLYYVFITIVAINMFTILCLIMDNGTHGNFAFNITKRQGANIAYANLFFGNIFFVIPMFTMMFIVSLQVLNDKEEAIYKKFDKCMSIILISLTLLLRYVSFFIFTILYGIITLEIVGAIYGGKDLEVLHNDGTNINQTDRIISGCVVYFVILMMPGVIYMLYKLPGIYEKASEFESLRRELSVNNNSINKNTYQESSNNYEPNAPPVAERLPYQNMNEVVYCQVHINTNQNQPQFQISDLFNINNWI